MGLYNVMSRCGLRRIRFVLGRNAFTQDFPVHCGEGINPLATGSPTSLSDDPMASEAVRRGTRIGLLCTATSTVEPSSALLRAHAAAQGRDVTIKTVLRPEAYQALMAGDRARHDEILLEAASGISNEVDVLVLAQASLAHLRDRLAAELKCPVLASPSLLMAEIARRCAE